MENFIFCAVIFVTSPSWVSLRPRWKNYSKVSPLKIFENLIFSSMSRAVPTGVLRQGVETEENVINHDNNELSSSFNSFNEALNHDKEKKRAAGKH